MWDQGRGRERAPIPNVCLFRLVKVIPMTFVWNLQRQAIRQRKKYKRKDKRMKERKLLSTWSLSYASRTSLCWSLNKNTILYVTVQGQKVRTNAYELWMHTNLTKAPWVKLLKREMSLIILLYVRSRHLSLTHTHTHSLNYSWNFSLFHKKGLRV